MCSTARVVPVGISTDDEPSLADDNEEDFLTSRPGTRTPRGAFAGDLDWDEDEPFMPTYTSLQQPLHAPNDSHREVQAPTFRGHESVDERSPLLSRVAEQSSAPRHAPSSVPTKPSPVGQSTFSQTVSRRVCLFSVSQAHGGPTWFGQLFNATALLLGIGMLSEPLAFSYAGWICGTLLIVLYGMFTCYTYVIAIGVSYVSNVELFSRRAKFLAGVVVSDPRVRTYADIGRKAFGVRSMPFVNFMFCVETFSVGYAQISLMPLRILMNRPVSSLSHCTRIH